MVMANDERSLLDAKTKRMMQRNEFQKCPRCGIMIEKASGCNHMTHGGCPNKTEVSGTHFCYVCGELLFGRHHNEERDGTRHFPDGVYRKCRKAKRTGLSAQNCILM